MNDRAITYVENLRARTKDTSAKNSFLNDLQLALILENKDDVKVLSIKLGLHREITNLCNTNK